MSHFVDQRQDGLAQRSGSGLLYWLLFILNAGFTAAALLAWDTIGPWVVQPMTTATGLSMSDSVRPGLLEYPFVMMWALPLGCVYVAHSVGKWGARDLATFLVAYPPLLMGTSIWWHVHGQNMLFIY